VDPIMFHGFGRLAVEGMMCGCRVLASNRVGCLSWNDPIDAAVHANERFWDFIRRRCKKQRGQRLRLWPLQIHVQGGQDE
jgi:hypothetical protein